MACLPNLNFRANYLTQGHGPSVLQPGIEDWEYPNVFSQVRRVAAFVPILALSLLQVSFLKCMTHLELLQLADALEPRTYKDKEYLIRFDDDGEWMFLIIEVGGPEHRARKGLNCANESDMIGCLKLKAFPLARQREGGCIQYRAATVRFFGDDLMRL